MGDSDSEDDMPLSKRKVANGAKKRPLQEPENPRKKIKNDNELKEQNLQAVPMDPGSDDSGSESVELNLFIEPKPEAKKVSPAKNGDVAVKEKKQTTEKKRKTTSKKQESKKQETQKQTKEIP